MRGILDSDEGGLARRTLLWQLATQPRQGCGPVLRYDRDRQVSQVLENGDWVDSWRATVLAGTKKHDVETGEDSKGQ